MNIKAEEISKIIRDQIGSYAVEIDVAEVGTVITVGDGIARIYGVERAMAGEMLEFPNGAFRHRAQSRSRQRRRGAAGEFPRAQGRRRGEADGSHHLGADRRRAAGTGGRMRSASPSMAKGRSCAKQLDADRTTRSRRHRSSAGPRAASDRAQGHRLDDPDRPRAARADHWRPPDGQDGHRASTRFSINTTRTSSASTSRSGRNSRRLRRSSRFSKTPGRCGTRLSSASPASDPAPMLYISSVCGVHDGRVFPRQRPPRAVRLRRSDEARAVVSRDLAAPAPAAGTRGVSGRRVLSALAAARAGGEDAGRRSAADRSPPFPSSRRRPATSPPTFRPT